MSILLCVPSAVKSSTGEISYLRPFLGASCVRTAASTRRITLEPSLRLP